MRVALYARVSTDDKGQDPTTQMDIIRDIAQRRDYVIEGEYIDYASGKDANRPQWKEIMRMVHDHRIDGIMALRLDRVMRSVQHLCSTIDQLTACKVKLIFSDMELDPTNPNSMLTINMLSAIAEWERQIISARTREGLAHRKSKGVKLGRKPRDDLPIHTIALMRLKGDGWKKISDTIGIPKSTITDHRSAIETEMKVIKGSEDLSCTENRSEYGGCD